MELIYASETGGGAEITIRMDARERGVLAQDVALPFLLHRAMEAVIALRTGERPAGRSTEASNWAEMAGWTEKLIRILEGVRDGSVRGFDGAQGSHGQLARAFGVARSTAQTRREALLAKEPSPWEPSPLIPTLLAQTDEWGRRRCQLMVQFVDDVEIVQCALTAGHGGECDPLSEVPDIRAQERS